MARGQDSEWIYYGAPDARPREIFFGPMTWTPYETGLARSIKDPAKFAHFTNNIIMLGAVKNLPPFEVRRVEEIVENELMQELIYNGRSGSEVKFLYRETSGGLARAPSSQQFQHDLADGNVVGFKGARLEVIEATNSQITYRVLATFADN